MTQGILPFKYETEKKTTGMTALGGLPTYLDLAQVMGNTEASKSTRRRPGVDG